MAVNYNIRAEVVDISSDSPGAHDSFLIDTNVWYWMTYSKASQAGANAYQINSYPAYVSSAIGNGSNIFHSGLSLAEIAHIIERAEREIYRASSGVWVGTKEFRHNLSAERAAVCGEVSSACMQIMSMSSSLDACVDSSLSSAALKRLGVNAVDGYDLFILESMSSGDVVQVITDDGDYATVDGIRVFTANMNVLKAARAQGKLVSRK